MKSFRKEYRNYSSALADLETAKRNLKTALLQKLEDEILGLETIEGLSVAVVDRNEIILTAYLERHDGKLGIQLNTDIYSNTTILHF